MFKQKELILDKGFSIDGAKKELQRQKNGDQVEVSLQSDMKTDLMEIKLFLEQLREKL